MNKQRAAQLYELADRLSKVDVNTLSEEQLAQRSAMIAKLQEEVKGVTEDTETYKQGHAKFHTKTNKQIGPTHYGRGSDKKADSYTKADPRYHEIRPVKEQGVAENSSNIGSAIKSLYQKIYNAGDDEIEYFYHDSPIFAQYWDEYEGDLDNIIAEVDPKELQVIHDELESYVQNANLKEDVDSEYNDEAGMAKGSLQTMSRAVTGLMDTIQQGDNLPEWAQEKLSLAEDYLTTVWDYLLSQKEQGVEPKLESVDNGMPKDIKNKSSKLTAVTMKKTDPVSEEINTEAYERLQKVFAFKNYES